MKESMILPVQEIGSGGRLIDEGVLASLNLTVLIIIDGTWGFL